MKNIFTTQRTVIHSEIDALNHVNNVVYLQWMEDIANLHWLNLTKENPQEKYIWVVLRHEIDYLRAAILGDLITLKTWVGETNGAKSTRHIEILKGNEIIVKAVSIWCFLDAITMRPKRIDESVLKILQR